MIGVLRKEHTLGMWTSTDNITTPNCAVAC